MRELSKIGIGGVNDDDDDDDDDSGGSVAGKNLTRKVREVGLIRQSDQSDLIPRSEDRHTHYIGVKVRLKIEMSAGTKEDNTAIDVNRNDIDRGDVNGRVDVNMNVGRRDVNVQRRNMQDAMSRKSLPRCQEEIRVNANANPVLSPM
ncbi:hypothetical protein BU17DRAFT_93796 [Hysterangium stoloniferum]|nr:hypothetical protein BU17DRAFT_93796 [Hysterangium stoloniferum]